MDDFTTWQALLQTAVAGTGRTLLPPPLLEELSARGIDIYAPAEEVLLAAAALTRQRIRAAQVLPQRLQPFPGPVAPEHGVINPAASRFLFVMLTGKYAHAIPEWLELLSRSSLSLPPESLPGLLNRCVADPNLRALLEPHLGVRARWLIAQNPAWADLEKPLPGEQQQRLGLFIKQEKLDPKKVAGLPEGEILEQLKRFAGSCLLHKENRPTLKIPHELPEWVCESGLVRKGKKQDHTSAFQTLLGWIPPSYWEERLGERPGPVYDHFSITFYDEIWRRGLVNAVNLYMDAQWARAILRSHANRKQSTTLSPQEAKQLAALLPADEFQHIILAAWENGGPYLDDTDVTIELALNSHHPWNEALSREWVKEFQKTLFLPGGEGWNLLQYKEYMRKIAYKVPPIEEASWLGGWENIPLKRLHYWKDDIDHYLRVLKFRIDMHKAFFT